MLCADIAGIMIDVLLDYSFYMIAIFAHIGVNDGRSQMEMLMGIGSVGALGNLIIQSSIATMILVNKFITMHTPCRSQGRTRKREGHKNDSKQDGHHTNRLFMDISSCSLIDP